MAFSPDGRLLASASEDETIRLWDVAQRRSLTSFTGHPFGVNTLAFSPCGRRLASGGEDGRIKLWDLDTLDVWSGKTTLGAVNAVAFTPDGRYLLSVGGKYGEPGTFAVWNVSRRRPCLHLWEHNNEVLSVSISRSGALAATGDYDGHVRLWDLSDGIPTSHGAGQAHQGGVWSLNYDPGADLLVSAGEDGVLRFWDVAVGMECTTFPDGADFGVLAAGFTHDGSTLALGSSDGRVYLCDAPFHGRPVLVGRHDAAILCVACSPDGRYLATGGLDDQVGLWALKQRGWQSSGDAETVADVDSGLEKT